MMAMTRHSSDRAAKALGWFSIGLGVSQFIGADRLRCMFGGRRTGIGIALPTASDPTPWVWARVAGDGLDLGSLAGGFRTGSPSKGNRLLALLVVAATGAVDVACARRIQPRTPLAGI
ncbi:hypothetical protein HN018_01675 [Lichenicola cladoniae]|uniref:Uncharacterized protein n=1 Tax=Lichenicola cladoniae TaxID=1484109 RepID=A0A6M8HG80_9PROT|nr:hypothetical protein [Lichenicola cladoniae]NPD68598.1 hypothetical protein [Acetobacteraceae bacterium]QKE88927.1 hypothetical protein HN018_01675 [Lichenicola cladoniae]